MRFAAILCVVAAGAVPAGAQTLICFGNEPSWSVELSTPDRARVTAVLGGPPVEYRGSETRNEPLRERVWRGRASADSGEMVLFLRDAACSDGMSDDTHPVIARLSMPDGAFLAGCCRIPRSPAVAKPEANPAFGGIAWSVTGHNNGRQAVVSPIVTTRLTLSFEQGTVSGQAGCNTFRASYSLDGGRITIGAAAATRKMCAAEVMAQEREFLTALSTVAKWEVQGNLLSLYRADGERAIIASSGPAK